MARIRQLTSQALYEKEGGACKAKESLCLQVY